MNKKLMASEFSKWLKENRRKSELTLIQLRDKISGLCTDAYLSRLENDKFKSKKGNPAQPDIEIVESLAIALNRPIDEARWAAGYKLLKDSNLPYELASIDYSVFTSEEIKEIADFINFKLMQKLATKAVITDKHEKAAGVTVFPNRSSQEGQNITPTDKKRVLVDKEKEIIESEKKRKSG